MQYFAQGVKSSLCISEQNQIRRAKIKFGCLLRIEILKVLNDFTIFYGDHEGGQKVRRNWVTSFMNAPFELYFIFMQILQRLVKHFLGTIIQRRYMI